MPASWGQPASNNWPTQRVKVEATQSKSEGLSQLQSSSCNQAETAPVQLLHQWDSASFTPPSVLSLRAHPNKLPACKSFFFLNTLLGKQESKPLDRQGRPQISILESVSQRTQPATLIKEILSFPDPLLYFLLSF